MASSFWNAQGPLISNSVSRFGNFSEKLDGIIPFEFESDHGLKDQSSETSSDTPLMTSSTQNLCPPTEALDSSSTDSSLMNDLRDDSSALAVPAQIQEISPAISFHVFSDSHNTAEEASNSAKSSADSRSEYPCSSVYMHDEYSLVGAGLENLGDTCFLNSILQCLTYTTLFVQGLRTADHLQICQCGHQYFCLFCAIHSHIELSLFSSGEIVVPYKLVNNMSYISPHFQKFQKEDAHEFLQCLLDKLGGPCLFILGNERRFACESDRIVKSIFGGSLVSKLRCCNCGHLSNTNEPLIDLSLEIENVNSLYGALESFISVEKLDDPGMRFTCDNCKMVVSKEKQLMLDEVPSVATIHLKRFKSDGITVEKIQKRVKFPLELDLKPYTWPARDTDVDLRYELYGVVVHVGEQSTSGHYISLVRTAPNSWFMLDDSRVTLVPESYVLSRSAYILFYAKKGTPWACTLMEGPKPRFDKYFDCREQKIEHYNEQMRLVGGVRNHRGHGSGGIEKMKLGSGDARRKLPRRRSVARSTSAGN